MIFIGLIDAPLRFKLSELILVESNSTKYFLHVSMCNMIQFYWYPSRYDT